MTADEWLVTINKLVSKTRQGKIVWRHAEDGGSSQAAVGERHVVRLSYVRVHEHDRAQAARESLALALCDAEGETLAVLSEEASRGEAGQPAVMALRGLFEAVVVEPRRRALDGFRSALEDL